MASFFSKLFSGGAERRLRAFADRVNAEEPALISLSHEELKKASDELRKTVGEAGDPKVMLGEQLPRAFALVREAAKRNLGQRHFDVQLMGGLRG